MEEDQEVVKHFSVVEQNQASGLFRLMLSPSEKKNPILFCRTATKRCASAGIGEQKHYPALKLESIWHHMTCVKRSAANLLCAKTDPLKLQD